MDAPVRSAEVGEVGSHVPHMLRADARENRDRVLEAARDLFGQHGLGVTMREVARHAEVGPATLYRRFPTKQHLVEAAFADEIRSCQGIVEEACAEPDAWTGFCAVVERILVLNSRNQGFTEAYTAANPQGWSLAVHRVQQMRSLREMARRAKASGQLRADFTLDDLVLVLQSARGLSALPPRGRTAAARRLATLAIDGFRAR